MKKSSIVRFAEAELKSDFEKLKNSSFEDRQLYNFINQAFDNLEENAFCGIQIPKKQIPREYLKKFKINNCWKYNLPNAWRLIYSVVSSDEIKVISLILEWFDHKKYNKKFKYKKS